jgi:hypothetical protein
MRVSEYYRLDRTQPTLDFVDVDIHGDVRVFVDPRALRLVHSEWGDECVALIQDFFGTVLSCIGDGRNARAQVLLKYLREPNETHLGLSRGRARGRAVGSESAQDVWQVLSTSEAIKSGLLEDLEDTILMVEGISSDIISDITTNIIREPLIHYTQEMAAYYGIPLVPEVNSGPLWDPETQQWRSGFVALPVTRWGKLLLVPKVIVRRRLDYDADEYYRHYLLEYLREVELSANTELVRLLKDGRPHVTKKDLSEKYGSGKRVIVLETLRHPEVLEKYRRDKRRVFLPPLSHDEIAESQGTPTPDWEGLLAAVVATPAGREAYTLFENVAESLLTALFYPALTNPQVQREIHEGRKRVDITYTNVATKGFFHWLGMHYPAPHIFVECKNYRRELGNPELDQISGRFSPSRGQVGIIVCRGFEDKLAFMQRCRDTATDQRGFIIAIDDSDLSAMVTARTSQGDDLSFPLLRQRFEALIL